MHALLTDPDAFFEQRADNPRLLVAAGIVVLTAIAAAISVVPKADLSGRVATAQANASGELNASSQEVIGSIAGSFTIGVAFLVVLVGWFLYAGGFHLVAGLFMDGEGSFGETMAIAGWGFLPLLLGKVANAAANFYVFGGETLPAADEAAIEAYNDLQAEPALLAAAVLGVLLLVWAGALWTYGVKHLHELSLRNAAIAVWIPTGIALALRLPGLL